MANMTVAEAAAKARELVTMQRTTVSAGAAAALGMVPGPAWEMIAPLGAPDEAPLYYPPDDYRRTQDAVKVKRVYVALRLLGHRHRDIGETALTVCWHRPKATLRQLVREADFLITGIAKAA
jgi:hypothetical protein